MDLSASPSGGALTTTSGSSTDTTTGAITLRPVNSSAGGVIGNIVRRSGTTISGDRVTVVMGSSAAASVIGGAVGHAMGTSVYSTGGAITLAGGTCVTGGAVSVEAGIDEVSTGKAVSLSAGL